MSKKPIAEDRRKFLKLAAVTGGAVAVGGVVQASLAEPEEEKSAAEDETSTKGYHETDHIREYYEKARF